MSSQETSGAYVIREEQLKHLEGRLLTMVEAFGVTNEAAKSLISQEIWDIVENYTWIEEEEIKKLVNVKN